MELSQLLARIRRRWREDEKHEFYMLSDGQIDAELQRKSRVWPRVNRVYAYDDAEGVAYPAEKLEKHAQRVERDLLLILMAFLAGELSRAGARKRGFLLLEESYKALIKDIDAFYAALGLKGKLAPEAEKLRKALETSKEEFTKSLDAERGTYWASEAGNKQVANLVAIWLVYNVASIIALSIAQSYGVEVLLRWRTVLPLPGVCEVCAALEGKEYPPNQPPAVLPGEVHLGCRCRFELIFREGSR